MLRQSRENFLVQVQRNISTNGFLESLWIFQQFRNSSKEFSEFWREVFGSVVTTAFYMYIGTFWGNLFSFRKIHTFFRRFWNLSGNLVNFWRNFSGRIVEIAFPFVRESFLLKKTLLFKKLYIHLVWNLGEFFVFLPTMLQQACQNFNSHVQTNISTNSPFGKLVNFSSIP